MLALGLIWEPKLYQKIYKSARERLAEVDVLEVEAEVYARVRGESEERISALAAARRAAEVAQQPAVRRLGGAPLNGDSAPGAHPALAGAGGGGGHGGGHGGGSSPKKRGKKKKKKAR